MKKNPHAALMTRLVIQGVTLTPRDRKTSPTLYAIKIRVLTKRIFQPRDTFAVRSLIHRRR